MRLLSLLTSNYLINVGFISWFGAQALKVLLVYLQSGKWEKERMFGAGGMPSSHSALVCSLAIGMVRKVGFQAPEFALSLAFAAIVMYDAMGVRRAAGEQAKLLNRLVFGFRYMDLGKPDDTKDEEEESAEDPKKLKEYLGHTPLQVLGGALFGILVAMAIPVI